MEMIRNNRIVLTMMSLDKAHLVFNNNPNMLFEKKWFAVLLEYRIYGEGRLMIVKYISMGSLHMIT
jgi:hypothetical protein